MSGENPPSINVTLEPSEDWKGILGNGESILWQGRPDPNKPITLATLGQIAFGLLFAGFALFWMAIASRAGGFFWMFGLIHFAVGLGMAGRAAIWPRIKLSNTWYTLTNRHAFIATSIPLQGQKLRSWAINADSVLTFDEGPPPSVGFGFETVKRRNKKQLSAIGFERIADGRAVYGIMRDLRHRDLARTLSEKDNTR